MLVAADGENFDTANAYCDLEYAGEYHSVRGNTAWDGSDEVLEAALIRATDYIEQVYGPRFIGITTRITGLSWPRYSTPFAYDAIPDNLKKATCELALEALSGALNPSISPEPRIKREKIDIIDTEYDLSGPNYTIRPSINGLIGPLLTGSTFNVKAVRV